MTGGTSSVTIRARRSQIAKTIPDLGKLADPCETDHSISRRGCVFQLNPADTTTSMTHTVRSNTRYMHTVSTCPASSLAEPISSEFGGEALRKLNNGKSAGGLGVVFQYVIEGTDTHLSLRGHLGVWGL